MSQTDGLFEDYDNEVVYDKVRRWLQNPQARNFVVEFGRNAAKIACDLDSAQFKGLIEQDETTKSPDRPVRWM
jgi:hypothetical protein